MINLKVSYSELLGVDIDRTADNDPPGNLYYITLYHERVGVYTL